METVTQNRTEVNDRQADALQRAISGQSASNYAAIIAGFLQRGVPEDDILPRTNIFTFMAWRAVGRTVKRGEHGVKIVTFVPMQTKDENPETGEITIKTKTRPRTVTVFHESQTRAVI